MRDDYRDIITYDDAVRLAPAAEPPAPLTERQYEGARRLLNKSLFQLRQRDLSLEERRYHVWCARWWSRRLGGEAALRRLDAVLERERLADAS